MAPSFVLWTIRATKFVSSRIHNFSHLESIEVYTVRENVNLVDVLAGHGEKQRSPAFRKRCRCHKTYFEKVYPDLDFERVYSSDLKKMVKWYDVLKQNNIEIKLCEPAEEPEEEAVVVEEEVKEKPKKAAKKEEEERRSSCKSARKKSGKSKTGGKRRSSKENKSGKTRCRKSRPKEKEIISGS